MKAFEITQVPAVSLKPSLPAPRRLELASYFPRYDGAGNHSRSPTFHCPTPRPAFFRDFVVFRPPIFRENHLSVLVTFFLPLADP